MTASSAIRREVRWRVTGTTAWSDIASCSPVAELTLENLDRTKTYDVEVRDISACGAKSAWVMHAAVVPDVAPGNIVLSDAYAAAVTAQADADAANAALANIASDNLLTAGEKPTVIRDWNVIAAEQAGIDAQATAYGITTEKTNYDNAVTALANYLGTLTAPKMWNDLSGDTTIVGATFRSNFASVYTTRQTLLNAIYAAAKAKADAAQSTANTAVGQVTQLPVINGGFDIAPTGYGWTADSGTGWITDTGSNSPGVQPNCARHTGTSSPTTGAYRNNGLAPCQPGQVYKTQALIKAVGANGTCYVYISWCNAAGGEIGTTIGNAVTGTTTAGSYAVGAAPAGTVFARTCLAYSGQTVGDYFVDNVVCTQYPSSIGEVPDGGGYSKVNSSQVNQGVVTLLGTGRNAVLNPNFTQNFSGRVANASVSTGAVIDHWTISGVSANSAGYWSGSNINVRVLAGFSIAGSSTTIGPVISSDPFAVKAADGFALKIDRSGYASNGAPAGVSPYHRVYLSFLDSSGNVVSNSIYDAVYGGTIAAITVTGSVPAGAVSCIARLNIYFVNTGAATTWPAGFIDATLNSIEYVQAAAMDTEITDGTIYGRTSQSDLYISGGVNRVGLRVAGSNHVLGNQLNAPNSLTLNYGAARTTTAVTASSTGAVSINAFSVNMGGTTVSYSAVSNAITGLSQSVTYQIYCHDLGGTGGTKTWLAVAGTANALLTLGDDVVLAGQVTIPTSGTSGGGGGGYCVCDDMMIDADTLAGEAPVGYLFDCMDIPTQGMRKFRRRLQSVEYTTVPCVRITTDAGAILECSTTTPFDVLDGRTVHAPDMLGEQVVTDKGIETVARVDDIGERRVCYIHLGGVSYAAGADPAHRIYSHNLKP